MEAEKKLAVARIESEKLMATGQAKLQLSQIEVRKFILVPFTEACSSSIH